MPRLAFWTLSFLASWASLAASAAEPPPRLDRPADHVLVWADEFSGSGLPDPSKWVYDVGMNKKGWHNNELQYYSAARTANSEVRNGRLHITARKERLKELPDWGGQAYSSARLITKGKGEWTYGYFEVRAKLACGKGTWPAIWMLGVEGEWPDGGELDIMEHIGHQEGRVFSTVHTRSGFAGDGKGGVAAPLPTACTQFHNYQMLWTPDSVRFGIDGVEHARYDNQRQGPKQWPFDRPQFMILNIAIGGDLGGKVTDADLPTTMEVEHVRVYQKAR